jgi:hypothetical protein
LPATTGEQRNPAEIFEQTSVCFFEIALGALLGQLAVFLAYLLPGLLNRLLGLDI